MKSLKRGAFIVFLLFFLTLSFISIEAQESATVHGFVYNIFLEELDKVVITVNSEPQQTIVSQNGEYSFNILPGEYTITAEYYTDNDVYETTQEIKITNSGDYQIDLILIPNLEDTNNIGEEFETPEEPKKKSTTAFVAAIIAILLIILYFYFSKGHFIKETELKSETEEKLDKVVELIKQQGGRITQKEIRKKFPSSEAKISLMITELESKGIVKRIKKGRSNIIILK